MTTPPPPRCFQIPQLTRLRAARKLAGDNIDGIWSSVNNDEFFSLCAYVSAFTGINLNGYRQKEDRGAFDACAKTLDALERVVALMNGSQELTQFAARAFGARSFEIRHKEAETTWQAFTASSGAPSTMELLLLTIGREFAVWAIRDGDEDVSDLIEFAPGHAGRDVELVFSGGGIRAAAFALGVVLYILDVEHFDRVRQISSVSGGSITNGFLANRLTGSRGFDEAGVAQLAKRLASQGMPLEKAGRYVAALFGTATVLSIGAALFVLLVALGFDKVLLTASATAFATSLLVGFLTYRMFKGVTDGLVNGWFAFIINESKASVGMLGAMDILSRRRLLTRLLRADGLKLRRLGDIDSPITHVFTATDLRNGEHFHFSQEFAISNTYGSTDSGGVLLFEAVQASAAFPGALPPVKIALDRLRLPQDRTAGMKALELVDRGVRDNLGHLFQTRLLKADSQRNVLTQYGQTKLSIVADASAPRGVADLSENVLRLIPILRRIEQLIAFPRVLSIMNQSNSEARSLALATHLGRQGFVLRIRDSPVDVCSEAIQNPEVARSLLGGGPGSIHAKEASGLRAEAALRALVRNGGAVESHWNGVRNDNQTTPTTLDELGAERVARLMRQAYVLTMCQAHIDFDWPLAPDRHWTVDRFAELLKAESSTVATDRATAVRH